MEVCAITTWPPHRDGIALYSAKLYTGMAKLANIKVATNTVSKQTSGAIKEINNIAVVRCWKRGNPLYILQILNRVLKSRADIVHVQHGWLLYGGVISSTLFPLLLCFLRLSHKRVIITMHTVIRRDAFTYGPFLVSQLAKMTTFLVTKMLALLMKRVLLREFGLRKDKIIIIPHGVEKAKTVFEDEHKRKEKFQILSLSFLREKKRLEYLIKAFQRVSMQYPNARLVIIGGRHTHDDASCVTKLKRLVSNSSVRTKVIFTNFVTEDALNQFVLASDAIVLLSGERGYVETSGAVARVADFEKPVICSKVPKFQGELNDGNNCVMVEPSNSEHLSKAINLLLENAELRKNLALNLKTKFSPRYWDTVAKKHLKLYECVLKNSYSHSIVIN
jgi:glycosyltransferase involved in cell wall biosynthesis